MARIFPGNPKGLLQKLGRASRRTGHRKRAKVGRPRSTSYARIRTTVRPGNGLTRSKIGWPKLRLVRMMTTLWPAHLSQPFCRCEVHTYEGPHLAGELPSDRIKARGLIVFSFRRCAICGAIYIRSRNSFKNCVASSGSRTRHNETMHIRQIYSTRPNTHQ